MRDAKSTDVSWRAISEVALKCLEDAIDGGRGGDGEATHGVMEGRSAGVAVQRVTSPTLSLRVRDI